MQERDRAPAAGPRAAPWLLLPIEIFAREIDTRLLLALTAVRRGSAVIVGYLSDAAFRHAPPGALLYKSHNASAGRYMASWIAQGHACAALDEEGLLWSSPETYVADRIDVGLCGGLARIFAWGEEQAALFPPALRDRLAITGHPKFDLVRLAPPRPSRAPGAAVSVLVNTRFPLVTGFVRPGPTVDAAFIANERAILDLVEQAVRLLAQDPRFRVRVRPHPSERAGHYVERFADLPSVEVEAGRNLIEAFRDSDAVVHDSCTTAIEAAAYGLPVFGLRPAGLEHHYDTLANRFSTRNFHDPARLRDALGALGQAAGGAAAIADAAPPQARRSIANLSGPLACPAILDALAAVAPPPAVAPAAWSPARTAARLAGAQAARLARRLLRPGAEAVREEKFSETLTAADVVTRLRRLNAGLAEPFDLDGLRVAKLSKRAFLIAPA